MRPKTPSLCLVFLVFFATRPVHAGCIRAPDLSKTVSEFSANQTSRVAALLQFGQDRNLCFGLEYVTPSLLIDLADLRIHDVTVREAIELILGEPGLEIRMDKSVIVVTRRVPPAESKNVFDYVLPRFAVRRASAQEMSAALYMQLLLQLNPAITGFAGNHPVGDAENLVGPISESNRSLRYLLNTIVSESKGGAWIASVPWKARKDLQIAKRHSPWSVIEYGVKAGYTAILHSLAADLSSNARDDTAEDTFEQLVPSLSLNNQTIIDGLAELNAATNVAFSVEFPLGHSISAPAPALRAFNLRIGPATLTQALDDLCNMDETFAWKRIGNTANVFPRDSPNDKSYLFNQILDSVNYVGTPDAQKAVFETVAQLSGPKQQIALLQSGTSITFAHPWTASLKNITVREAFDRIAQQLGPAYGWQFGGGNDFRVITFHQRLLAKAPKSRPHGAS